MSSHYSGLGRDSYEGKASDRIKPGSIDRLPSTYMKVAYIESTGTQYIDTGVVIGNGFRLVSDIAFTAIEDDSTYGSAFGGYFGQSGNIHYRMYFGGYPDNTVSYGLLEHFVTGNITGNTNPQKYSYILDKQYPIEFQIQSDNSYCKFDNIMLASSNTRISLNVPATLTLFGRYSVNSEKMFLSKGVRFSKTLIYDESNNLVRNLVPCCRRSDLCAGMYDVLNKTFYTNAGTGVFLVGDSVQ